MSQIIASTKEISNKRTLQIASRFSLENQIAEQENETAAAALKNNVIV